MDLYSRFKLGLTNFFFFKGPVLQLLLLIEEADKLYLCRQIKNRGGIMVLTDG